MLIVIILCVSVFVALIISILMVVGIAWIEPLFKGTGRSKKSIRIDNERTNNALRMSEERFRSLYESSKDGIASIDMQGNLLEANQAFLDMVGYTTEELKGLTFHQLTPKKWVKMEAEIIENQIMTRGYCDEYEKEYIRKDGSIIPISLRAWLVKDEKGKPTGMWGLVRDITERKRAEQEVTQARIYLDRSLSSAPLGIFLIDKQGRFTYANPTFLKMIGYETKEIVEKTIQEIVPKIVPPESAKIIQERAEKRLQTGEQIVGAEVQLINKDKQIIPVSYSAAGIQNTEGKIIGEVVFLRDITQLKQAENKLQILNKNLEQRALDLERSNKELEQFAYIASHDLQEPLRMVSSYTQLLEQRYKDRLDEDARDFINYAVDGANRMQRLINDLLTYSRLGTRGKPFERTDCHSVLGQVLVNLDKIIQENHALVTNDDLPTIMADETQFSQLFQNLIANAIKFKSEEQPRIHVSVDEKKDEWLFSVRDNGIGIEPEFKDRIFIIFQRLHSAGKYPGTGMGLAICKKIIERHGGKIWFDSVPGKGSTFFFTIPKKGEIS